MIDVRNSEQSVTVIVPVFNGEDFIEEALQTVLQQDDVPLQIMVVDDGSTDSTKEKVLAHGRSVTYIRQENRGPAAARNAGIARATTDLIAFLDSDDLWPPGRLEVMLDQFAKEPGVEVVLGQTRTVSLPGSGRIAPDLMKPCILPHFGAGLFKMSAFEKVGRMDPSLRLSEDQDWFLRAREAGLAITVLKKVTLIRRAHAGSLTADLDWRHANLTRVLKKSLDRRRERGGQKPDELPRLSDFVD